MRRTRPGAVRTVLTAAGAAAVLLLAGCGPSGPTATSTSSKTTADSGGVSVDTPALRAARKKAGLDACPDVKDAGTAPGDALPAVTLPCLGGGSDVDLSSLRGPLVLNLWAQWCGPCRGELPYYEKLHESSGGKLQVLGVDYQDTRPDWALDLLQQTGVTYPSLADPGGDLRVPLRVRGLPAILFVDADGRVVHQEFTVIDSYAQLADMVHEHLGVTVGAAG